MTNNKSMSHLFIFLILQARHTLRDWSQIDRFVGLLVSAIRPRNKTRLIRGTSRRNEKCDPCDENFDAKYEYTIEDWSPKQVPATSPLACATFN